MAFSGIQLPLLLRNFGRRTGVHLCDANVVRLLDGSAISLQSLDGWGVECIKGPTRHVIWVQRLMKRYVNNVASRNLIYESYGLTKV